MYKKLIILLLTIIWSFPLAALVGAEQNIESDEIDYLALGDSLAAGQTPYRKFDKGYPDFIAEKLDAMGVMRSFTKRYAVSGYTTSDVLHDIRNDVRKGAEDTMGIRQHITQAEIITLDVGANDILKEMNLPFELYLDPNKVPVILQRISINTNQIIQEIRSLNAHAKIYLMGYYICLPYLLAQDDPLWGVVDEMNNTLLHVAEDHQVTFVPTKDVIAGQNIGVYLPNYFDIHPSLQGYQAIANEYWKWIGVDVIDSDGNGIIDLFDISAGQKKGESTWLVQYGKSIPK